MSCLEKILFFPPVKFNEKKLAQKITGKTILITGATFGIGATLTYKFANYNTNLILVARTESKLLAIKKVVERKGSSANLFSVDLYDIEQVEKLTEKLKKEKIDIFINNAGKSIRRSIFKSLDRFHDFTRTMSINYYTPVKILLSIIPTLRENNGHIINISSMACIIFPAPKWSAYQASKAAYDNWFRSISPELKAAKIKTTSIYLPLVKTRMILPTKKYKKMPAMTTKQVSNIILKSIINGRKKYTPWWSIFVQLGSVLFRNTIERFFIQQEKKKYIN